MGLISAFAVASGCGIELADADQDTETGGQTGGADTDGFASTGEDPADATGFPGTGEGDTDFTGGGGGSTGETDGPDDTVSACDALDCSGAGFCELGDDGPVCVCDPGHASTGLDCLRCDTISAGMLPAEVPTVRASFTFALDGEQAPQSGLHFGRITLRNRASGDVVPVGPTNAAATVLMVPGVYDVLYEYREGNDFPRNSAAVLQQVEVNANNAEIKIDISPILVRGTISFAEGSEPDSPGLNFGRLWLVNPSTGDRIKIGTTKDDTYEVRVVPGDYEVHYEFRESQGQAPINADGFVMDLTVKDSGDAVRDIVVPVARLAGSVLIDSQTIGSGLDYGELELRDRITGDRFHLGDSNEASYSVTILPGVYDVLYTAKEFGGLAPVNQNALVQTIEIGNGDHGLLIDLETSLLSGVFTVDTTEPPTVDYDDGIVTLESPNGDPIVLGNTRAGSYERRVLRGTYDVFYAQDTASQSMPVNTHAKLGKPVTIDTQLRSLDVDIDVVEVLGTMTIDGVPAPDSAYDDGRVFLRNAETGDSVLLGNTREGNYAARVVPGTYDIVYSNEFSDTLLPVNRGAVLGSPVIVSVDATLDIDVPVATLIGSVAIEGSTPSTTEGVGNLFLRDAKTDDQVFIGNTTAAEFSKPLTSGTYLMEYRGTAIAGGTLGASLPANANAAFACFEVISD